VLLIFGATLATLANVPFRGAAIFFGHPFTALSITALVALYWFGIRRGLSREMLRVLRPNGHILWYDCRLSNPARAVRGLNRRDIARLFPNCRIDFAVTTLVPPLSRAIARHSCALAAALESLRFTCTHLAAVISPERT